MIFVDAIKEIMEIWRDNVEVTIVKRLLISLGAFLIFVLLFLALSFGKAEAQNITATFNENTQCPGGASPRSDIEECWTFDDVASCDNGDFQTDACWVANHPHTATTFPSGLTSFDGGGSNTGIYATTDTDGDTSIHHPGGLVGAGALFLGGKRGSTGGGAYQYNLQNPLDELRVRFYIRYSEDFTNYANNRGPHGWGIETLPATAGGQYCRRTARFESSSEGWGAYNFAQDKNGAVCGYIAPGAQNMNVGLYFDDDLKNGQTYAIEVAVKFDTTCTDVTDKFGCDGVFKLWIDGVLKFDHNDYNWGYYDSVQNGNTTPKFDFTWLFAQYHHAAIADWEPGYWIDEIVISSDADLEIGETTQSLTKGVGDPNSPHYMSAGQEPIVTQNVLTDGTNPCKLRSDCSCPDTYHYAFAGGSNTTSPDFLNRTSWSSKSFFYNQWFDNGGRGVNPLYCDNDDTDPNKGYYTVDGFEQDGSIKVTLTSGQDEAWRKNNWFPAAVAGNTTVKHTCASANVLLADGNDYSSIPFYFGLSNYNDADGEVGDVLGLVVNPATNKWAVAMRDNGHNSGNVDILADSTVTPVPDTTPNDDTDDIWISAEVCLNPGETNYWFYVNGTKVVDNAVLPNPLSDGSSHQGFFWGVEGYGGATTFEAYIDNPAASTFSREDPTVGWGDGFAPSVGIGTSSFFSAEIVSLAVTTASASEPSTDGLFTVTLTGAAPTGGLTVSYSVSGTASAGVDYTTLSGSLVIPQGQTSGTIAVDVIDDVATESTETVIVTLTSTSDSDFGLGSSSGTVNIADNESGIISTIATKGGTLLRGIGIR